MSQLHAVQAPAHSATPSSLGRGLCLIALLAVGMASGHAEEGVDEPLVLAAVDNPAAYKGLSIEELMDIDVSSASKHPEKLSQSASAIQVISGNDIHRSGAISLPEALRLAPNLQVAQINASQWAISSRGFNNSLANKLLVMIDGRTVYTPLYAGVFWDSQHVLLDDVDRIEVVSGPGGTLWGANAVNGVINVISKSAQETQGTYASASSGSFLRDSAAIRSGGRIGEDLFMRVYGMRSDFNSTRLARTDDDAPDDWAMMQGGFRMDWEPAGNTVTLQGDAYKGSPHPTGGTSASVAGNNVLGRWTHGISATSEFQLQAYYDQAWRDFGNRLTETLNTYDLDWQHRFQINPRMRVVWGLGCRVMDDIESNLPTIVFKPSHRTLEVYSGFAQNEITLVPDLLRFTIGSKVEHNDYTGIEVQPSGRLALTPERQHTVWFAVSRAVRTPSRVDRDLYVFSATGATLLAGNSNFESEKLIASELGWRFHAEEVLSLSVASFYNLYNDLRSVEPPGPQPAMVGNGVRGKTYGVELAATYQAMNPWRLRGGYTFLRKHLWVKSDSNDINGGSGEGNDPQSQWVLQSTVDLPADWQFDTVFRYVSSLPRPYVPHVLQLDVRVACQATKHVEVALVGQNLLKSSHPEFIANPAHEIERSAYGNVTIRW